MTNCEICPILASHNDGKDVQVIETDVWRVVLDPNQRFLGKSFVTLLDHKQALSDLSSADWQDFHTLVQRLEGALRSAFAPNHFNWSCLMNIAAMNGQETHVHWHIHPRYAAPVSFSGEVFEDTQWYPITENVDHVVSRDVLEEVAKEIRAHL